MNSASKKKSNKVIVPFFTFSHANNRSVVSMLPWVGFLLFLLAFHNSCTSTLLSQPVKTPAKNLLAEVIIGGLPKETETTKKCPIRQLSPHVDIAQWKQLILAAAKSPIIKGFHITPRIPSKEIYVYQQNQKILLMKDHATIEKRQGKAVDKLIHEIEKMCQ